MHKRDRWISEGAPHFRRALERIGLADQLPSEAAHYACPCCLTAFTPEDAERHLTIEHVPPEALGGKAMMLTCGQCNNEAGSNFDSHADKRAAIYGVLSGRGTRPVRATFWADGIPVRGQVESSGDGFLMLGVPRQNNPEIVDAHTQALHEATERRESPTFSFSLSEQYSPRRADVSWIRSAYLAAFAALGWRYILRPALGPIRRHLKADSTTELPRIIGFNPAADSSERSIMIVQEPESLSSVLISIGHYTVFLPDPWGTLSLEELAQSIARLRDESGTVTSTLNGQAVPWPTKPMYLLDKATP